MGLMKRQPIDTEITTLVIPCVTDTRAPSALPSYSQGRDVRTLWRKELIQTTALRPRRSVNLTVLGYLGSPDKPDIPTSL